MVIQEFGGPEVLKLVDLEVPKLEANQVLIRVKATSVNFADIMARQGKYHAAGKPPIIPGLDAAGVIEEVGPAVKHLKVGQRVIALPSNGTYAEYIVADENLTFVLPDHVDFQTAAASPIVSFTSYKLLADVARIQPGESVLIHAAAGGIGTTAIQLAKLLGASLVIGTVGSDKKIPVAKEAGADVVLNYQTDDFVSKVNELTEGNGVDIVLDSVAGEVGERSLNCLAMYGRLVNFGNASGRHAQIHTTDIYPTCRSVLGFSLGTTRKNRPELLRQPAEKVLNYLAAGKLDMKIGHRFQLNEAAEAHRLIESRESVGKVVLEV